MVFPLAYAVISGSFSIVSWRVMVLVELENDDGDAYGDTGAKEDEAGYPEALYLDFLGIHSAHKFGIVGVDTAAGGFSEWSFHDVVSLYLAMSFPLSSLCGMVSIFIPAHRRSWILAPSRKHPNWLRACSGVIDLPFSSKAAILSECDFMVFDLLGLCLGARYRR
jgi:hypothetical protein